MGKVNDFVLPHKKEDQKNDLMKQYMLYQQLKTEKIMDMSENSLICHVASQANWLTRSRYHSCSDLGIIANVGDICFMDFGEAYLLESGYQHFALIISVSHGKAFVIPMTSNPLMYEQAYDSKKNPNGKKHLMAIGLVEGMNRKSVLFLNDAKFVNTARVIDVKAHIPVDSYLFKKIRYRLAKTLQL